MPPPIECDYYLAFFSKRPSLIYPNRPRSRARIFFEDRDDMSELGVGIQAGMQTASRLKLTRAFISAMH